MHEIMHAIGFLHEQSRPDRDQHIEVLYQNIKSGESTLTITDLPEVSLLLENPRGKNAKIEKAQNSKRVRQSHELRVALAPESEPFGARA